MTCACNPDAVPAEFSSLTYPRARKSHRCCECGGTIRKGEKYQRVDGLWEPGFDTLKTCLPCMEARNALSRRFCTPAFGDLLDELCHLDEADVGTFPRNRLVAEMRERSTRGE